MFRVISNILLSTSIILLLGGGIYFSIKLSFPQFKWKKFFIGFSEKSNISPLKSLMISLAARIGVGGVAGIALAIYLGGPGTIFWIWLIGIITSVNAFIESYLALKYQEKDKDEYISGPSYYIEKGLKNKQLAYLYAILIIIAYIVGFMTIQANTITVSLNNSYKIDKVLVALVLGIISFLSIIKGLKTVISITSKIVPIMGMGYIILGLLVIGKNIDLIPNIIKFIIKDAWNIKAFSSSFMPAFLIGIKRGIFSTEAGLGTSSIATGATTSKNKINLALIQILGIYFTVFIICTTTALIILTSNYEFLIINNINGIELIEYALNYHLGSIGSLVLIVMIILLAYSTIVAGYYYGESSLKYLYKNKKAPVFLLKIITVLLLFIGSLINSIFLWKLVDVIVCILAITNMYALLKLRKEVIFDYKKSK